MTPPRLTSARLAVALAGTLASVSAQGPGRGRVPAPQPAATSAPKAGAPIGLAGCRVSVVAADGRWRIVTPQARSPARQMGPGAGQGRLTARSERPAAA